MAGSLIGTISTLDGRQVGITRNLQADILSERSLPWSVLSSKSKRIVLC